MNINIITVGNIKEKFFTDACNEYLKRLSRFARVNIIEIKEVRGGDSQDICAEGEAILKRICPGDYVVALCVEGKQKTSEEFAEFFKSATLSGTSTFTFIIGGSDGLDVAVKNLAALKLSFSKMTFPHQLMRVVLLEQIYRAFKIINGEKYHK